MEKISDYQKIMQVLEAKGVSPNQAEIDIGVKPGVIGKLPSRRGGFGRMHKTNTDNFIRIFKVNPKWWETGKGEMFISDNRDNSSNVRIGGRTESPDYVFAFIDTLKELVLDKNNEVERMRQDRDKEIQRIQDEKSKLHSHIESLITQISSSK